MKPSKTVIVRNRKTRKTRFMIVREKKVKTSKLKEMR